MNMSRLQNTFLDCNRAHGKTNSQRTLKGFDLLQQPFFWTSYLMFWHCYPCKCSVQCLWILRALFCTWIVRVVGDRLILRRWWLTHAFIPGYAPLWCQRRERDQKRKRKKWDGRERGGGGKTKRGEGRGKDVRKKYKETDRKPCRNGRDKSLITMYYWCVAICRNRVFINTVDTKRSFIQKHKEHFAFADIINIALSSTKTEMKRGDYVLCNKSSQ